MFSTELTSPLEEDFSEPILQDTSTTPPCQGEVTNFNNSTNIVHTSLTNETIESTPSLLTKLASEILVYCQNFNRMKSSTKIKEIQNQILGCSYPIILGTETSWNESVRSEEVFGNCYNVFRDDRNLQTSEKKSGGGVLIAVSTEMNSELITTKKHKEFEHVWAKVFIGCETHVFSSVYFAPNNARKESYDKFLQIADDIMSKFPPECKFHIYGDFNQRNVDFIPDDENEAILLPVIGENETLQYMFDKIASLGLNQINDVKNQQNCYLDLLFTNIHEDFCVTESLCPLWKNEAYHTAVEYSLFVQENNRPDEYEYEEEFQYHSANYNTIKHKINAIDWQSILKNEENVENSVDVFL